MQIDFRKVCLAVAYLVYTDGFQALQLFNSICCDLSPISCSRSYRTLAWSRFVLLPSTVNQDLWLNSQDTLMFQAVHSLIYVYKLAWLPPSDNIFGMEARLVRSISSRYTKVTRHAILLQVYSSFYILILFLTLLLAVRIRLPIRLKRILLIQVYTRSGTLHWFVVVACLWHFSDIPQF